MTKKRYTIGIYGIQDINQSNVPTIAHDHSIAIMEKGAVKYHAQLERLNRKKHSCDMPEMLYDLLRDKKLLTDSHDLVFVDNVAGRSFINIEGNIRFEAPLSSSLHNGIEKGALWWLDKKIPAYILNHELAHLGSCLSFFGSFKEDSLLVHFDGGASMSNFSAWHYKNKTLSKVEAHWKLKKVSSFFNANGLMFGIMRAKPIDLNGVPGKLMGFASYGQYSQNMHNFLKRYNYFEDSWKSKKTFFDAVAKEFGVSIKHIDQKDKFIQDIAATVQEVFIQDTLAQIKKMKEITKAKNLYYSGGSALNIVLNTKLIESNLFDQVFIPPCCNDSGLAMGAAAFYEWSKASDIKIHEPYLNNWNIEDYKTEYDESDIATIAEMLVNKKVIGVCNGAGEIGPRALGNRSILCLANSRQLAQKVSMQHKEREWYRPVAPIMLEKNAKYFTGLNHIHPLSKYMLLDFKILDSKKQELQGAVHVDGTARIQTIFNRNKNPFIYDLLDWLDAKYDIKALINTSFNGRGEPIVHTISDAKKSAQKMKLDAVVLNGKLNLFSV